MGYSTLMMGPERRRRWSEDQRLALVEAAFAPGSSVAEVARQADICTSLIYRWRQSLRKEPGFVPVLISDTPPTASASAEPALVVEFAGGQRVLIGAGAPAGLVAAALQALR